MSLRNIAVLTMLFAFLARGAWANFLPSAVGGNIGIGTTAPQAKLSVVGGMTVSGQGTFGSMSVTGQSTLNTIALSLGSTVNEITTSVGAASSDGQLPTAHAVYTAISGGTTMIKDSTTSVSVINGAANPIQFAVSGSNSMVIDSQGNVGIGTSAPLGKLMIPSGNVGIGTTNATANLTVRGNVVINLQ